MIPAIPEIHNIFFIFPIRSFCNGDQIIRYSSCRFVTLGIVIYFRKIFYSQPGAVSFWELAYFLVGTLLLENILPRVEVSQLTVTLHPRGPMMEKLAPAHYPIHDLIQKRWSPLAFSDRPIPANDLASLLEAARWSPSSYNEQPWAFLVAEKVTNPSGFAKLLSCVVEANQIWAGNASVLMIGLAKTHFARNNKENRHAAFDLGAAVAHLTLQATDLGIQVHQMAGFDPVKTRELAQVPDSYDPIVAIALGYYGELSSLPETYQERELAPRSRHPIQDFAFSDTWGDSFI